MNLLRSCIPYCIYIQILLSQLYSLFLIFSITFNLISKIGIITYLNNVYNTPPPAFFKIEYLLTFTLKTEILFSIYYIINYTKY